MKLQGSYTVPAPRDLVWQKLMDPETLANALPGCEKFEPDKTGSFAVILKIGIGAVQGTYQGRVEIANPQPPESYNMKVEGKGAGGFLKGEGMLTLAESPEGTSIHYSGDAQIGGLLASVGQRLVEVVARQVVSQFFQSFAKQVQAPQS